MAVKYECPKCQRRFVDWGAERLGFKCPHDERCTDVSPSDVIALIKVTAGGELAEAAASLKRKPKKEVIAVPVEEEIDDVVDEDADDEVLEEEVEEVIEEDVVIVDGIVADDDVVDEDADEDVSNEEEPVDLDFGADKVGFDEGPVREFDE